MDVQDIERIRRIYERWSEGEMAGDIFHPEVEVVWADGMLDTSVDKGLGAFVKTLRQYTEVVPDWRLVAQEFHPRAADVVVLAEFTGTGKESGVPTQTPVTHIWEMSGGKAVRVTGHFGHRRDLIPDGG